MSLYSAQKILTSCVGAAQACLKFTCSSTSDGNSNLYFDRMASPVGTESSFSRCSLLEWHTGKKTKKEILLL